MKLSHDFFFRFLVVVGCVGTIVHGIGIMVREPFSVVPWYGVFGFFTALGIYGTIWAITP